MKIIILGGFLGSGKTTLLIKLANIIVTKYIDEVQTPLVIIENEIGEISVDGKIVENSGYKVKEIFSGCICCTLAGDLTSSIIDIKNMYNPKYIVVETTGLAYPGRVVDTIKTYTNGYDDIITIILADASRWYDLMDYMDVFVSGQLRAADVILLNKTDLVDENTVEKISAEILEINQKAIVNNISANTDKSDTLNGLLEGIL